jgi:hypothetical protein
MRCDGEVCHVSSQRIRVHFPKAKGNQPYLRALGSHFATLPYVTRVITNSRTGSVVLSHQGREEAVIRAIEEGKEFPLSLQFTPRPKPLSKLVKHQVKHSLYQANQRMAFYSDGAIDMPTILGVGLLGLALLQFRNGFFLPAGLTLALLAYRTLDHEPTLVL